MLDRLYNFILAICLSPLYAVYLFLLSFFSLTDWYYIKYNMVQQMDQPTYIYVVTSFTNALEDKVGCKKVYTTDKSIEFQTNRHL